MPTLGATRLSAVRGGRLPRMLGKRWTTPPDGPVRSCLDFSGLERVVEVQSKLLSENRIYCFQVIPTHQKFRVRTVWTARIKPSSTTGGSSPNVPRVNITYPPNPSTRSGRQESRVYSFVQSWMPLCHQCWVTACEVPLAGNNPLPGAIGTARAQTNAANNGGGPLVSGVSFAQPPNLF